MASNKVLIVIYTIDSEQILSVSFLLFSSRFLIDIGYGHVTSTYNVYETHNSVT